MKNHKTLTAFIASVVILALAGSTVLALTTFRRDVGGSVTADIHLPDGIEVYLDQALTQVADDVAFGAVTVDLFGTEGGGEPVPVWIHNRSLSTVRTPRKSSGPITCPVRSSAVSSATSFSTASRFTAYECRTTSSLRSSYSTQTERSSRSYARLPRPCDRTSIASNFSQAKDARRK